MAKAPRKAPKKTSGDSTTGKVRAKYANAPSAASVKQKSKGANVSAPAGHAPLVAEVPCGCCPDCAGKASGTMGGCEDGVCRDIPPPVSTTTGPWVLYWNRNANGNFPYWESVGNVAAQNPALVAQLLSMMTPGINALIAAQIQAACQ